MRIQILVLTIVLFALAAAPAFAAVSSYLAIQGRLTNSTGALYTGAANFTFKIWNDSTSTAAANLLYTENWNASTSCSYISVQDGIFNALLGSCNSPGPALNSLPFNQDYWLELTVNGSLLSPRHRISSVAYGFRANITENLAAEANATGNLNMNSKDIYSVNNLNATNGFFTTNVGIGTASPGANLEVVGTTPGLAFKVMEGSTNLFAANATTDCIGVGTTGPGAKLEVMGTGIMLFNVRNTTGNYLFDVSYTGDVGIGTDSPNARLGISSGSGTNGLSLNVSGDLYVNDTSGNVGINATNPAVILELNASTDTGLRLTTGRNGYNTQLSQYNGSWYGLYNPFIIQPVTGSPRNISITPVVNSPSSGIVILSSGKVGIGTTSPGGLFHVNNTTATSSSERQVIFSKAGGGGGDRWVSFVMNDVAGGWNPMLSAGDMAIVFSNGTQNYGNLSIAPYSSLSSGIKITKDGYIGINTTSPSVALDVRDGGINIGYMTGINTGAYAGVGDITMRPLGATSQWEYFRIINSHTSGASMEASLPLGLSLQAAPGVHGYPENIIGLYANGVINFSVGSGYAPSTEVMRITNTTSGVGIVNITNGTLYANTTVYPAGGSVGSCQEFNTTASLIGVIAVDASFCMDNTTKNGTIFDGCDLRLFDTGSGGGIAAAATGVFGQNGTSGSGFYWVSTFMNGTSPYVFTGSGTNGDSTSVIIIASSFCALYDDNSTAGETSSTGFSLTDRGNIDTCILTICD